MAIWVVLGLYLFEVITISTDGINLGVQIYPADIVFVFLFSATLFRLLLFGLVWKVDKALLTLSTLILFSLIRGMASYGIKTAGMESRVVFDFMVSTLYFSTCRINRAFLAKLCDLWLGTCVVLLALTVFRWIAVALNLSFVAQFADIVGETPMRVVTAAVAFFLATGFLMSFYLESSKKGPLWQRKLLYYTGPAVLLLQHRTVWVLLIVSFAWMSWRDRRFRKWLPIGIASMAVIGTIMVAVVFGSKGGVNTYLMDSATNDTTIIWRLAGWIQLLAGFFASGVVALFVGNPFGAGWTRMLGGSLVNAVPHDYYVEILLRTGFLGLFVLLLVYRSAMRKPRTVNPYPGWRFWTVAMIAQLIYNVTYGLGYEQGIILGIVIAMTPATKQSVPRRSTSSRLQAGTSQFMGEDDRPPEPSAL
jgi:hypothetical protein